MTITAEAGKPIYVRLTLPTFMAASIAILALCVGLVIQGRIVDDQHAEILKGVDDKSYHFAVGFLDACGSPCVIRENRGGSLRDFEMLAALVRVRQALVIIDGPCVSACVLFADMARQYVQITRKASFHFHKDSIEEDPPHAPDIARWVNGHGGFPAFASNCLTQMPFAEARRFWRPVFDWYAIPHQIDPLPVWSELDPLGFIRKGRELRRVDTVAALPEIILRGTVQ